MSLLELRKAYPAAELFASRLARGPSAGDARVDIDGTEFIELRGDGFAALAWMDVEFDICWLVACRELAGADVWTGRSDDYTPVRADYRAPLRERLRHDLPLLRSQLTALRRSVRRDVGEEGMGTVQLPDGTLVSAVVAHDEQGELRLWVAVTRRFSIVPAVLAELMPPEANPAWELVREFPTKELGDDEWVHRSRPLRANELDFGSAP